MVIRFVSANQITAGGLAASEYTGKLSVYVGGPPVVMQRMLSW